MTLEQAVGVSRVARVTALDRTGVEVACAVRPEGHVLQVTNGKGERFVHAAAGAVLEAAELFCAERVEPGDLVYASARDLAARRLQYVPSEALSGGGASEGGLRLAWREGLDLASGASVLVPAAAVHVPPAGGPLLGPTAVRWTSNGMGAHPAWTAALEHALLEIVERDQLARALPSGWTARAVRARWIAPDIVAQVAARVALLCSRLERAGFEAHLFDLAPEDGLGVPVVGALLFDVPGAPVPLTAGYACRITPAHALHAALLEAAQSRLTDIHGAREDVTHGDQHGVEDLRRVCRNRRRDGHSAIPPSWERRHGPGTGPAPPVSRLTGKENEPPGRPSRLSSPAPSPTSGTARGVGRARQAEVDSVASSIVRHLDRAGIRRCVALDLAPAGFPVRVAKVVAPGLLLSELL